MMREVKALSSSDLAKHLDIFANAYPGISLDSDRNRQSFLTRMKATYEDPSRQLYGLFEDGNLLGVMMLYDFEMTLYDRPVTVGGVGQIAVDLLHKKQKVAKEMMTFLMRHYLVEGASLLMLYPFRPDFYKKMGFGYGTKINHYRFRPSALPRDDSLTSLRFLTKDDGPAMLECYNRYAEKTHGMVIRSGREINSFLSRPSIRIVGYEEQDKILGYLVFDFEKGSTFIRNDLRIVELIYEEPATLLQLMTFLHKQSDQIQWIVHNTHDDLFHHLLFDPRNQTGHLIPSVYHETNSQGVGLMYRAIDVRALFRLLADHDFGGQTCRLRLFINDSFLANGELTIIVNVKGGKAIVVPAGEYDVTIRMDISDFSSMIMGVIDFNTLYHYGLAKVSDKNYVTIVDSAFRVDRKPVCMTHF